MPPRISAPRGLLYQTLVIGAVVLLGALLVHNTLANLARAGVATGFGYLGAQASFAIGDTLIPYTAADSYGRALLVGLLNTLLVSVLGCIFATLFGTLVGLARLSGNWLVARLAAGFVEVVRNVPLLLQLILWWDLLRMSAPPPRAAWQPLPHVFVSNRGVVFPVPVWSPVYAEMAIALAVAILVGFALAAWSRHRRRPLDTGRLTAALAILLPLAVFVLAGMPFRWDLPVLGGFNFTGGRTVTPEFVALLAGLTVYTAAFIAEIVRGGILGVARGQSEAAAALGLPRAAALRFVILPQALRIIIPPLLSEYLALAKNSSLAVYIGYFDLMNISDTTANQTGQSVEVLALMMAIYLALSLSISSVGNWYGHRLEVGRR